jgi:hypothetical protein
MKACDARLILPNQDLQREINPNFLVRLHERCSAFGIAEYQKVGRAQRQSNLGGFLGMR